MPLWRKYGPEIGLGILLLLFVVFKIPDLSLPYFWDELGVYAPGSLRLHDTKISLLPGALDPELSRGHPLLTVAAYATWMRLAGDSVLAAHTFSLILGCATLLVLYATSARLLGRIVALLAVLFTAAQPVFWAMSGVIMPEMLLTLFTLLAAYGLLRGRWGIYLTACSLAILTKESALTILPASCLFLFLEGLAKRDLNKARRWGQIFLAAAPILTFAAFLLVQKAQNGWYFFPLHVGYIDTSFWHMKRATRRALEDLFLEQGRWLVGYAAATGLLLAWVYRRVRPQNARAILLFYLLILFAALFAAANFYLTRYLLYVVPLVTTVAAWTVVTVARLFRPPVVRYVLVGLTAAGATWLGRTNLAVHGFQDTSDMGYVHVVRCKQAALRWAEAQPWRYTRVGANFPVFQALQDPRNGYLARPWPYSENCQQPTKYAIIWHGGGEPPADTAVRPYTVIKHFNDDYAHISVLEFK